MNATELQRLQEAADRYERTLRAIKDCPLTGANFLDWVQAVCEDVLEGLDPECYNCGTFVHDGPCVEDCACSATTRCVDHGGVV